MRLRANRPDLRKVTANATAVGWGNKRIEQILSKFSRQAGGRCGSFKSDCLVRRNKAGGVDRLHGFRNHNSNSAKRSTRDPVVFQFNLISLGTLPRLSPRACSVISAWTLSRQVRDTMMRDTNHCTELLSMQPNSRPTIHKHQEEISLSVLRCYDRPEREGKHECLSAPERAFPE